MKDKIRKIAVLPGDGVGPAVTSAAVEALKATATVSGIRLELTEADVGGAAIDACGDPLPEATLELARASDAVLLGAVGGPKWDGLPRAKRPETALLELRRELGLFANLRPVRVFPELKGLSPLKDDFVAGVDILIVRELTGGLYYGRPRGVELRYGKRTGRNTHVYSEDEIARAAKVAFEAAKRRGKKLCSVDKANVLECDGLWREVVTEVGKDYPFVTLSHMYVDNAAMQIIRRPADFDVILAGNLYGDILSDEAAVLAGSIGLLPSASLDGSGKGLFEPIHGSAPDLAGRDIANPIGAILSVALLLRHSLGHGSAAERVESAVASVLAKGHRTSDIATPGTRPVGTAEMGRLIAGRIAGN